MVVAVEGMDGVGKTTICNYIKEKYGFIYVEKPTKYLFENKDGSINYCKFKKKLEKVYKMDDKSRSIFFGKGNLLAIKRFKNKNIVLDRHLVSNYYWNGNDDLKLYFINLIKLCGKPDITIYLYASPAVRYERLKVRDSNDLDLSDSTVFDDGFEKCVNFLNEFDFKYKVIDTNNLKIHQVFNEVDRIMKCLEK